MTRPWRINDSENAFSASTRVSPAAASSTAPRRFVVGQFAGLGGDRAGDLLDLLTARQIVLDDDELAFQLARDLEDRREDHEDRPVLLAGGDGRIERLNDLDAAQEPVEVPQDEQRRAVWRGQRADCLDRGQWVGGADGRVRALVASGDRQPAIDVPGGQ